MTEQTVAERFWAESRRKRERREEIAAMPYLIERLEATMADAWLAKPLTLELPRLDSILFRNPANELDQWLAEDGRIPEVASALGVRP